MTLKCQVAWSGDTTSTYNKQRLGWPCIL